MNENPKNHAEGRTEEYDAEMQAIIDEQLAKYATPEVVANERREAGPEVEAVEAIFEEFEKTHDLESLLAITDITLAEAQAHPTWMPAKLALDAIYKKYRVLKDETNITDEKFAELKATWKRLTQAVGMITSDGKLDHSPRSGPDFF